MRVIGIIFCGIAALSCFAIVITIQIVKDSYPVGPPEWMFLWVAATAIVGVVGLLCAFLVALGVE